MANYIDAFVLPISRNHLSAYKHVAEAVSEIWKEHGALAYLEYLGNDLKLQGTRSFPECIGVTEDEAIIFGWVVFESRETRDLTHKRVAADPRMKALIEPLIDPSKMIFNAERMVFGGFQSFIQ